MPLDDACMSRQSLAAYHVPPAPGSADESTWDGHSFVHTSSSTTGMCKLVAAGGAWTLPTIVTAGGKPPGP